ncbi:hypothetical protein F350042L8_34750 [Fusobacterium ulcerans]
MGAGSPATHVSILLSITRVCVQKETSKRAFIFRKKNKGEISLL